MNLSMRTVETYRDYAMKKHCLGCQADLFRYAVQKGWLYGS